MTIKVEGLLTQYNGISPTLHSPLLRGAGSDWGIFLDNYTKTDKISKNLKR
jgi:hypothetical protein